MIHPRGDGSIYIIDVRTSLPQQDAKRGGDRRRKATQRDEQKEEKKRLIVAQSLTTQARTHRHTPHFAPSTKKAQHNTLYAHTTPAPPRGSQ